MDKPSSTTEDRLKSFDTLLNWLDPDRQRAGEKYETIRLGLIRIFVWNGCSDAEGLADLTIDRGMQRLSKIVSSYQGDPRQYFYGIAKSILHEYYKRAALRYPDLQTLAVQDNVHGLADSTEYETDESRYNCLDKCLLTLSPESREIVLQYYRGSKQEKIEARRNLAAQLGIPSNALRVRMHRIRTTLEKCIDLCMEERHQDLNKVPRR